MLPGGAWRVYHETAPGQGHYIDVADYASIRDYVLSKRDRSGLLDIFPHLRGPVGSANLQSLHYDNSDYERTGGGDGQ